ncbi:VOC family protein [Brachybacterium sp. FME24]|uniref:VOC family protein n=1 Tax=Brachybacterium sp. FME24 TaxID=2742605 RepID=UPI00186606EE|nr:VOC family protein [Brachybacterium sp. FME24]
MTEPRTYPQGVPSWVDVETDDLDSATAFYGELFGWTFTEATAPGAGSRYLVGQLDGQDVAGISAPARTAQTGPGWTTYIAVEDAEVTAAHIQAAGGRILQGPTECGSAGRSTLAEDPAGVTFGLWQAGEHHGAQVANAPGAWNFSGLRARDPSVVTDFYTGVFGWQLQDAGFATLVRLPGYGDHLRDTIDPEIYARQAAIGDDGTFADAVAWLGAAGDDESPHWRVSFTVADRDAAGVDVERLGGTVVDRLDVEWSREATIRDPRGALFTISQFLA